MNAYGEVVAQVDEIYNGGDFMLLPNPVGRRKRVMLGLDNPDGGALLSCCICQREYMPSGTNQQACSAKCGRTRRNRKKREKRQAREAA